MKGRGIEPAKYETAYNDLLVKVETTIVARPGDDWGNPRRIREYALVLRQTLQHRAVKLFEGAIHALIHDNGYSMALSIRGHFETTAAIGYLHNRLTSLEQGNLTPEVVDKDIVTQIMGTRDALVLEASSQERAVSEAKQILSMLEYADKSVSKNIMGGTAKEHTMLMDSYKWLCEFSHPNFHSNTLAFTFDKEKNEFHFSCDRKITKQEAEGIQHILISSSIFEDLYDRIEALLPAE